ncbi:Hedgehog/intein hint domain-containing protein [Actinobacteria bacterium OV450]|nr:Hedgehog/intein hint domain-containing protein [Actinobacteria bacterium OV450]
MDKSVEALDEMNAVMVEVNQIIDGMNDGLAQANRGMDLLNEGVGQMNKGLEQTHKAVAGFNKAAEQLHGVPDFKFDFSHVAEAVGIPNLSDEERAAQARRESALLNLLPGIGDGKGIVEAITGKDMNTDEPVSVTDRVMGSLVVLSWLRRGGKLIPNDIFKARKTGKIPCNSFPADTPVLLGDGTTAPIQRIKTGDTVLATDPGTGTTGPRPVDATIYTPDERDFTDITLRPDAGQGSLTATDHHPFWSENRKQWTDAADLSVGDTLRTPNAPPQRSKRSPTGNNSSPLTT